MLWLYTTAWISPTRSPRTPFILERLTEGLSYMLQAGVVFHIAVTKYPAISRVSRHVQYRLASNAVYFMKKKRSADSRAEEACQAFWEWTCFFHLWQSSHLWLWQRPKEFCGEIRLYSCHFFKARIVNSKPVFSIRCFSVCQYKNLCTEMERVWWDVCQLIKN